MKLTIGWWQISVRRFYPTYNQLETMYDDAATHWHRRLKRLGYIHAYKDIFFSLQKSGVLAHMKQGASVCDCGIGTGAFSEALSQILRTRFNVRGVDLSSQMLQAAKQNLQKAGVNAKMSRASITAIPISDNTFDLVIAAHSLEHLAQPRLGLREMIRVLKPKTPLVFAFSNPGIISSCIQLRWGHKFLTKENVVKMMSDEGLTDIHFQHFTVGLARFTSYVCWGFKK